MDEIDYTGKLELGHNVKIGYFAQNQAQLMDENLSVFESIDNVAVGDIRTKIRSILGSFMFGGEASDKKVGVLSGGERGRLAMIKLLLEPVNLLILDEPTNHLDMASKDVLKQAINDFEGTAIIVSHDRDFLDGLVTKVYEFGGGKVIEHLGGIYDFLTKKRMDTLKQLEVSVNKSTPTTSEIEVEVATEKLTYEEQRELNRQKRRIEKQIEDFEKKIEELEAKIISIENELSTPEGGSNIELMSTYSETQDELQKVMSKWEDTMIELEEFN